MADLTLGYDPDFAPLTFAAGDRCRGLVIDILSRVFDIAGIDTAFVPVPLAGHDAAVTGGGTDGVAFKAVIAGRESAYDFSAPLMETGAAWFCLPGVRIGASGPPANARLATPARGPLAAQIQREYPDHPFIPVDSYDDALAAVVEGTADVAALNFHIGCHLSNRTFPGKFVLPAAPFQAMPIALALAAGRFGGVLARLNPVITALREVRGVSAIERQWLSN